MRRVCSWGGVAASAGFLREVRVGDAVEREVLRDRHGERVLGECALDELDGRRAVGGGHAVEQHELQRGLRVHEPAHGQRRVGAGGGGVGDDGRAVARDREVEVKVGAEVELDDAIDVGGPCAQLLDGVRVAVADDVLGAGLAGDGGLVVAAHGGGDVGTGPARQLHRGTTHRARATCDEHMLARDGAVGEQAVRGRHRGHAEGGAQGEGRVVREPHGVVVGDDAPLRGSAVAVAVRRKLQPYALADA